MAQHTLFGATAQGPNVVVMLSAAVILCVFAGA